MPNGQHALPSGDPHELLPGQVIPAALAAGALTAADVVTHGVMVEQVGRSHAVYRVSIGGVARFFVKAFGPRRGLTDGIPARERAVLDLARTRPAVAALVPEPWPWAMAETSSSPHGAVAVIATKAVPGAEAWTLDRPGSGRSRAEAWVDLVAALAPPLAAFHRATRDLARPNATVEPALRSIEPWALCLMDGDAAPELWHAGVTGAILHEAAADPMLVAGLREARAAWRPLALVHADLKHDNVLVERVSTGLRVVVLDWEMARLGDPAWDLAGLTARLIAADENSAPWTDADLDAAAWLVRTYAGASGLGPPGLARRQVLYTGAGLLMNALQTVAVQPESGFEPARTLVMKARATFRSIDPLTSAILRRVEPAAPA